MNIQNACKIALAAMPGYNIISASETESGWLFSFGLNDGSIPDLDPLFVSKSDGSIQTYVFEEHMMEILYATPIKLSELESDE